MFLLNIIIIITFISLSRSIVKVKYVGSEGPQQDNTNTINNLGYLAILISLIIIIINYIFFGLQINNPGIGDATVLYNKLLVLKEEVFNLEGVLLAFAFGILYSFSTKNPLISKSYSYSYTYNRGAIRPTESVGLIGIFSLLGGMLLLSSNNYILIFISIEIQSYSLYALASYYKNSYTSTDSGLKYFLLGGLASVFILFGTGLLYTGTSSTFLSEYYKLINIGYYNKVILGGFIFLLIGLLFKTASAPMHNWSPDVYDGVPTIITTWLSVLTKISILGIIYLLLEHVPQQIVYLVITCSALSMLIGAISGLQELKIKRLFAFSGVSNVGYLLLSLSNPNIDKFNSFVFYLIQYSISNINLFLILIILGYLFSVPSNDFNFKFWKEGFNKFSPISYINQLTGIYYYYPYLTLSLSVTLFSMIGIPPLLGFYGKYFIIIDTVQSQSYFIAFVLIFASVISSFYYLRVIKLFYSEVPNTSNTDLDSNQNLAIGYVTNNFSLPNKSVVINTYPISTLIALNTISTVFFFFFFIL